jgi:hypothetical protein
MPRSGGGGASARTDRKRLRGALLRNPVRIARYVSFLAAPLAFARAPAAVTHPLAPTRGVKSAAEIEHEWR